MSINRERLAGFAKNLIEVLNKHNLFNEEDLQKMVGRQIQVSDSLPHHVEVSHRPSVFQTYALTLSYIVDGLVMPIEAKFNNRLSYSLMIIKCETPIKRYSPFATDNLRNLIQSKRIEPCDLSLVRDEIVSLAGDKN